MEGVTVIVLHQLVTDAMETVQHPLKMVATVMVPAPNQLEQI